jgi:ribosomal protein S18 acetylase RimI-like enzyme
VRIRPVRPAERELLLDIEREAGRAFAGVGMPEIARDDPGTVDDVADAWVAVDEDDRPVAYLTSRVVDGNAHIEQVSVAPSHARRGIGAALIDHLAAVTGQPLTLTTFRDVPWNAPYYERLGFRIVEPGPELAALVREETERIPGDAPRVAMRRETVVTSP